MSVASFCCCPDEVTPADGANAQVWVARLFPDGFVYIGGQFTKYGGVSRTRVASLTQALGLRAPSWFIAAQAGGTVGGFSLDPLVADIAQRSGDKFYAVGFYTSQAFLSAVPINDVDPTADVVMFNLNGLIEEGFTPPAMTTYGDGRSRLYACQTANFIGASDSVLVAGDFIKVGGADKFALVVLQEDGSVYSGFNAGAAFVRDWQGGDPGDPDDPLHMAAFYLLPSVSGSSWYVSGGDGAAKMYYGTVDDPATRAFGGLVRISGTGSLDTGFTPGVDNGDDPDTGLVGQGWVALCEDGDGNIYIGSSLSGSAATGGWTADGTTFIRTSFMKLAPDGSLDTDFEVTIDGTVFAAALDGSGKIYIGGTFETVNGTTMIGLARLDASSGDLDTAFPNPEVSGGGGDMINSIVLQAGGSIIAAGKYVQIGNTPVVRNNIARLSSTGVVLP